MKEKLYTIPLNDAVNANDECPFCFVEREVEQGLLDFCLGSGSSYMVSEIRDITDKEGFCRAHYKKMFDYGNTLGNAWMLKTHYMEMRRQMDKVMDSYKPGAKPSIFAKKPADGGMRNSVAAWVKEKTDSCYICNQFKETYARYLDTFIYLWKNDPEFREKIKNSKGFCIAHFGDLCEAAENKLNEKEKEELFAVIFPLMRSNMERLQEDVNWMIEKFDHRNANADWKTSKDAIQRGMQKLKGGHPADPVYQQKK
ncbi:MAG: hypothetical protein IIZ41_03515 [Lachnospiraceae bacterium]|jgi:hypothetical protein|nr:hypothetical protein [Lachnospiraceae bacterium]